MSGRDAYYSTVDAQALPLDDSEAPTLTILGPNGTKRRPVPRVGTLTLGRHVDNDIQVDDPLVSRHHARIEIEGHGAFVVDLGGANGTDIAGRRIEPKGRALWPSGSALRLGETVLLLSVPSTRVEVDPHEVIVAAPAMRDLYAEASRVARARVSVLVLGETGVGKEVLAHAVHERSPRAEAPFVALNCGALAESLLESELFGYTKGAFTGADEDKPGLLEAASGGTLFLDEVGELPQRMQVKLLRVLEQQEVLRLGARAASPIDVRFVAATNRDLEAEANSGRFRADLYYRLAGVTLRIPPLRERIDEILPLAERFLAQAAKEAGLPTPRLDEDAAQRLRAHPWPGNLREMKNVLTRAALLCEAGVVGAALIPVAPGRSPATIPSADAVEGSTERARIVAALEAHAGNQTRAAAALGISRQTLSKKLDRHQIPRPRK